ncbi:MAG: LuxR C-terminal-related transcriptional regulator [Streptosporangiaceae bacterium]
MPAPKVRVPVASTTLTRRDRLLRLLEPEAPDEPAPDVTLVCAPAGSGKTMLLAAWARERHADTTGSDARPVAWATVDADDNDVFPLWSAILAALEATGAWGPDSALYRLTPPRAAMESGFLAAVVEAFDELNGPVWLVLDDLHQLHDAAALRSLEMLLRTIPNRLRLVLAARYEPTLGLARLRLEGRLRDIDAEALTFTREEARLLLAQHGIRLADGAMELLWERTEGWAAGLRLAILSLDGEEEPETIIADFVGDDRAVADYLIDEVLSRLPEHIRQFFLATSVCDEVTVDLAAALSGREDAGEILHRLARANALTVRLGRRSDWYRYHPLLRGYLRAELNRRHLSARHRLHRTASAWFAAHDAPVRAIEHAMVGDDPDATTRLLQAHGLRLLMAGEGAALRRVLGDVPDAIMRRPAVALVAAAAALDIGDVAAADVGMGHLSTDATAHEDGRLRALHAAVALNRARLGGDMVAALATLAATNADDTGDPDLDLYALANRGTACLWLGRHDAADRDLQRAATLAVLQGHDYLALHCMSHLAAVAGARGDFVELASRAARALDFAEPHGWAHTSSCAYAHLMAAWVEYQNLDDEAARRHVSTALEVMEGRSDTTIELTARVLRAATSFDGAGDRHAVVAQLRAHWQRYGEEQVTPELAAVSIPLEQRMALQTGEIEWATEAARRIQGLLGTGGESNLVHAVLQARKGRTQDARGTLRPILDGSARCLTATTLIDAWLLEATLAGQSGDAYRAHEALRAALALAAPRRALRPFVDAGRPMRDLLAAGVGRFGRHERFAADVLAALQPDPVGPIDPLTERELELFAELPAMRTVDEIAAALYVSVNTVKTHLRGIYRKLGVTTRRDAVAAARRCGLL